ncbi:MAG: hypothetical protein KO254_04420 [Methanoculleus marisnigri]|nr:hypothetical protein [Methanoculleus marisnigri]
MIPLNPADYELIKPARSGKPWPAFKCYYCGKPASYRESFEARDREGRCYTRCVCDDCYQAAREDRHDGIVYRQRRSKHSGNFAGRLHANGEGTGVKSESPKCLWCAIFGAVPE